MTEPTLRELAANVILAANEVIRLTADPAADRVNRDAVTGQVLTCSSCRWWGPSAAQERLAGTRPCAAVHFDGEAFGAFLTLNADGVETPWRELQEDDYPPYPGEGRWLDRRIDLRTRPDFFCAMHETEPKGPA